MRSMVKGDVVPYWVPGFRLESKRMLSFRPCVGLQERRELEEERARSTYAQEKLQCTMLRRGMGQQRQNRVEWQRRELPAATVQWSQVRGKVGFVKSPWRLPIEILKRCSSSGFPK